MAAYAGVSLWFIHPFLWVKSRSNTNAAREKKQHQRAKVKFMLMKI